jgi:protein-S-isoprenylcysteine O-methyltransferase Ste14
VNTRSLSGGLLVAAQFASLAWLLWPSGAWRTPVPVLIMLAAALLLGVWTLAHNRIGNFNIHPEPRPSGRLITGGPYRFMRHPMYVALLLFAAGIALGYGDAWKLPAWALLAVVLGLKAALEERRLKSLYPEYAAYASRVKGFIPGIF